jgi:hypothetical protein
VTVYGLLRVVLPNISCTIKTATSLLVPATYALFFPSVISFPVGVPFHKNPDLQHSPIYVFEVSCCMTMFEKDMIFNAVFSASGVEKPALFQCRYFVVATLLPAYLDSVKLMKNIEGCGCAC